MKRIPALLIAVALAVAVIAGTFAALRTTQLGASAAAPRVSTAQLRTRNRALDRIEATLRKQLRQTPPSLPAVPSVAPRGAAAPQAVIYVRPKSIVHIVHRSGENENEHEGGDD